MPEKLYYVKVGNEQIFEELARKGLGEKKLRVIDDGHVTIFEIGDDWTNTEKTVLKDIVKAVFPDKKFMKEESK